MRVQHASRLPGYSPGSVSHYHGSRGGRACLPALTGLRCSGVFRPRARSAGRRGGRGWDAL